MKVLHVIPSLSPALGGPPQVALNLVHELRQTGVDAEIVTTNHNGDRPLNVPLFQRIQYSATGDEQRAVPVWFLPHSRPALKEFIFSAALTRWLWRHIPEYDVLDHHYLFSYAPTCAGAIARFKKVPYTVRTMGQLTPWALAQSATKKQIYTRLIERHNLNRAAAIHCTTPDEALDVRSFGISTPTVTLPLGVTPVPSCVHPQARLRQQYGIPSTIPIVLFLSRLHYKKRPELLLQSLAQLRSRQQPCHAIIAGSGDPAYVAELKNLAVSLGIAQHVTFPGLVSGQDKDLLLQGADLFVLPSFSENFGIAIAESVAAGLPVVITPGIQIAPDIAAYQAGLVVPGELNALTDAIAQILSNPKLRSCFSENGKRLAQEKYNWATIAQQLVSVYSQIAVQKNLLEDVRFDSSFLKTTVN
jgi:glycosyltransferase involved in cell wall biosynthesis